MFKVHKVVQTLFIFHTDIKDKEIRINDVIFQEIKDYMIHHDNQVVLSLLMLIQNSENDIRGRQKRDFSLGLGLLHVIKGNALRIGYEKSEEETIQRSSIDEVDSIGRVIRNIKDDDYRILVHYIVEGPFDRHRVQKNVVVHKNQVVKMAGRIEVDTFILNEDVYESILN